MQEQCHLLRLRGTQKSQIPGSSPAALLSMSSPINWILSLNEDDEMEEDAEDVAANGETLILIAEKDS